MAKYHRQAQQAGDPHGTRADQRQYARIGQRTSTRESGWHRPLLATALESIQDGLIVLDKHWRCVYANKAAAELLATVPEGLIGKVIWAVFPEARQSRFHEEFVRAVEQRSVVEFEEYYEPLHRWYGCRCYPTDKGLTVLFTDVAERRRTEETLKRSEMVLAQAGKMANLGAWDIEFTNSLEGISGNPLHWSAEVYRIFGCEPDSMEVTVDLFLQRVHPDDRQRILDAVARALADRQPYEIEHRIIRPDGMERIVLAHAEIEWDDQGRPLRMLGAVQDITDRKLAEKALRSSERRYRRLFEADQVGIYITKPDGTFLDCNDTMVKILGYDSREEVLQHRSADFYVDPQFREEAVRLLQKDGIYPAREGLVWRKDGSIAHALGWAVLLTDETTGEPYIQGLAVDITERRQAEEALRRSQMLLNETQALTKLGGWEFDVATGTITWTEGVYTIYGVPKDYDSSDVARDISFFAEEARPTVQNAFQRAVREGVPYDLEEEFIRADGTRLWVRTLGRPVVQNGKVVRVVGSIMDITERKRGEQALRESEQRFRFVLENSLDAAYRRDMQNDRYDYISPVIEKITGFSVQEAGEMPLEEMLNRVHPEDAERVSRELSEAMARGQGALEYRFRCKDEEYRWLADYLVVQKDRAGRPVYLTGIVRDITGRKEMEAELRQWNERLSEKVRSRTERLTAMVNQLRQEVARRVEAESKLWESGQMLEGFFQHTITPLAFMDRDFNFVRVNEAYARADRKTPESFVGKNHFDLYPNDENRAIFEWVVRTKQPYRVYAGLFHFLSDTSRGATYWNWQLTPLLDDAGEVQFLVLNLEDVTERQKAYQELQQRTRQLQHLAMELSQAEDRERKRLAEILHDDLQQMLAAAKFQVGMLNNQVRNDKTLQAMVGQIKQLLVESIGKSRSLSHELSPPALGQSDLREIFEWLAEQEKTKHGLIVHIDSAGPMEVGSDALNAFLYKTVQEMLFNVIKHAKVKEAYLRLRRRHGSLWLRVSDRGRGFDPQELGKTSGVGLLSVRERIELLGGHMKIKSAPGKGSVFIISVPDPGPPKLAAEETEPVGEAALPAAVARKKKRVKHMTGRRTRVLLADDHRVMREGLAAMLDEEQDIEVVGQAGDGREAVDLACQLAPDVVVMDVAMPAMAGDEASRQIKRHLPNTRIIALSMFEDAHVVQRMRRAGAEAYLSKTGPAEDLLAAIRNPQ
jgi:PAS domain S-box-containing protein